jgi:hypothetical protein
MDKKILYLIVAVVFILLLGTSLVTAIEKLNEKPKDLVIIRGVVRNTDHIAAPEGFLAPECDVIIHIPEVDLYINRGEIWYFATNLMFRAYEDGGGGWFVRSEIRYRNEDDPTEILEEYPDLEYTVICPCIPVSG